MLYYYGYLFPKHFNTPNERAAPTEQQSCHSLCTPPPRLGHLRRSAFLFPCDVRFPVSGVSGVTWCCPSCPIRVSQRRVSKADSGNTASFLFRPDWQSVLGRVLCCICSSMFSWALESFPPLGHCEQCCCEHWPVRVCLSLYFRFFQAYA